MTRRRILFALTAIAAGGAAILGAAGSFASARAAAPADPTRVLLDKDAAYARHTAFDTDER